MFFSRTKVNPFELSDQLNINYNYKREAKLRVKNEIFRNFDAEHRFGLLASLRSAV